MTRALIILRVGPQVTVQDLGRPGHLSEGLSRGGAADRSAHAEGAALLGQPSTFAALEMAGMGGEFEPTETLRIALTGAPMPARAGDRALAWNATHILEAGETLRIGPATSGSYGTLSVAGGIATPEFLGSRAAHLVAGIGERLSDGCTLPVGPDPKAEASLATLDVPDRFSGGTVRLVPGAQTAFYSSETRERFTKTEFTRDTRGNRQGVRLTFDGPPFAADGQRTILSEVIVPGDVQMTGDGTPFVLLPECQTTGGYPRIGSVLPEDLPVVAQTAPGAKLRFRFLTMEEARATHRDELTRFAELQRAVRPFLRDPRSMADLLSHQLISGVTAGTVADDGKEP